MSSLSNELPRKTILAWRNFAQTAEFRDGIDYLRLAQAPKVSGKTPIELVEAAFGWGAYMKALEDIEEVLTALPRNEQTLDEPPLGV